MMTLSLLLQFFYEVVDRFVHGHDGFLNSLVRRSRFTLALRFFFENKLKEKGGVTARPKRFEAFKLFDVFLK